jgi:hypothetical protein
MKVNVVGLHQVIHLTLTFESSFSGPNHGISDPNSSSLRTSGLNCFSAISFLQLYHKLLAFSET